MITSAEEFYRLRTSEAQGEYDRAAREDAPLEVWLDVVGRYPEMRPWVAQNKTVPVEILEILSKDPDAEVRWWVAMKRKLTEAIQLQLASDENSSVRERLAYNARATHAVLRVLAEDAEPQIREKARERLAEYK